MPTWNDINREIDSLGIPNAADTVRLKYLRILSERVQKPVIGYYSGFLWKKDRDGRFHAECAISDLDMNGFMACIHGLDRQAGVDLLIHTPGGGMEAARAIVEYLYKMFDRSKIRAIVPHMAMSAGTMIACATQQVLLGKHSCLGPTDPQIRGFAAMGIISEVERAIGEIKKEPMMQIVWQQVFQKYPPAFISDCERSIEGARTMVRSWLEANMLSGQDNPAEAASGVVQELMNYSGTTEHGHHFLIDKCREMGLNVAALEDDQPLQEDVLSVHHAYMASFARTNSIKYIDSSQGETWSVNG